MLQHGFVMLWHEQKSTFRPTYHVATQKDHAAACLGMLISIFHFQLFWSYFVSSLVLLLNYHLQDKNHM